MDEEIEIELPLSRTKKKQQAKALELLAEQMTALPEKAFKQLTMSGELVVEAVEARATKGHGSQRRQVKYLAGMLREREDEARLLQDQLQNLDQVGRSEKKDFHALEKLRDRLCDPTTFAAAFEEMLNSYPQIDQKVISRLARSVHQYADKRAFREIFKRLRDVD